MQMAIDLWCLDQLIAGHQPPTVRFYQWSPAAISLGYHQHDWPAAWHQMAHYGQSIDLVRRPTGGRAVLHQGDLTYAITMPLVGSRRLAYRQICDALVSAWQSLGVELQYGQGGRDYRHQPNCFALSTTADLTTSAGYKLIGSAQLRRDRHLLQHGSIRLWPDWALHQQVFGTAALPQSPAPSVIPLQAHQAWLETLIALMQAELAKAVGATFAVIPLTPTEQVEIAARAQELFIPPSSLPRREA